MAERILEAGLEALYQHGFNATSVQDITQAAGVPKGSFYNHFESKEALGVEAVNVYASRMGSMLTPLHSKSVSPLKRLHTYFKKMHQLLSDSQYAHPKTRISVAHLTSIDALGDIGDEFMSECQITNTGKQPTCEQLWAGLGKIAANSPDGVQ